MFAGLHKLLRFLRLRFSWSGSKKCYIESYCRKDENIWSLFVPGISYILRKPKAFRLLWLTTGKGNPSLFIGYP